ncbi:MFS transporter [Paenibacillus sp. Aloe-11]|uniref:MFS transporter n=1 Tax=Paenibacillus sp. Aloe-11 TaxID=1050222 RepID=UPI00024EF9FD|nr:tetracycline resistance MFS efflux pump [Paenibacillus sp. Aloe-11]EHS57133.1 putative multidrug resistance protein [Paenibacillus sp. Aloe-11]
MSNSPLQKKLPLFILMLNLFIALLGQGMVIPILPDYLKQFHVAGTAAGYLVAAFGAAQFLFSPIGGRWSDQYGRKKMILIGLALTVISDYIFAIAYHLPVLYLARFIGGIGLGIMVPSVLAYVADITTHDQRAKGMGYLSAAMSLGMVLGPGIGGLLAGFGVRFPYFIAAGLGLVATVLTFVLPETLPVEKRTQVHKEAATPSIWKQLVQSFTLPYFPLLVLVLVMTFGLVNYETVFSLYIEQKYGFSSMEISVLITLGAAIGIIVQVWFMDKLIRRIGEYNLIRYSLIVTSIALLLMLIKVNFSYLIAVSALFFLFNSLLRPTVNTLLSKQAGDQQGFVAGLNTTYNSLGNILGPVIAGTLFDVHINLPYILGAFILMATIGLIRRPKLQKKVSVEQ